MAKIAPVSSKYIVHAKIDIEGIVDKPDVIGAVFGQTEGLLGSELELRELQRSGRIGRIEVNINTSSGKTSGAITVPSSLDKAETALVAAALEVIQRIGPCNAKLEIQRIEDVRILKRNFVLDRAKRLLKFMTDNTLPDSQELADEVAQSVLVMRITEYGKDRLAAGPGIEEVDEIIVVEGRADVVNLLKHGIKNCISMNGTSVPKTILELSKKKIMTAFVDGDRGGDLIIKELLQTAEIDFVCKAPDGKEVEEITKKEIHKSLRGKITAEQAQLDLNERKPEPRKPRQNYQRKPLQRQPQIKEKEVFKNILDDLMGTRGASIMDKELNILGKVPVTELESTIKGVKGVYAIALDGGVNQRILKSAEINHIPFIITNGPPKSRTEGRVNVLTDRDLN